MQRFGHNTLFLACFISLGLVSCGGGSTNQVNSTSSVINSTYVLDSNNNLYISTGGVNYSKVETTGFPGGINYATQAGGDIAATVGSEGYISVSYNLQSWQAATAPATVKKNGLTLSYELYSLIAAKEAGLTPNSLGASTNIKPTIILAVGQGGTIQKVSSASSSLSFSQAIKQHKLKYRQVTRVTNNDLYSVAQAGNGNFIAVGANNTALLSTDMGDTFTPIKLPVATSTSNANSLQNIYDVEAFSNSNSDVKAFRNSDFGSQQMLVAAGDGGSLYTSADNGKNWESESEKILRQTGYNGAFLTVKAIDDQNGNPIIVAGGFGVNQNNTIHSPIVYETNGVWHSAEMPLALKNKRVDVRDVAAYEKRKLTAYAVEVSTSSSLSSRDFFLKKRNLMDAGESQVILNSNDGGKTWEIQRVTSGKSDSSSSIGDESINFNSLGNIFGNPSPSLAPTDDLVSDITKVVNNAVSGFSLTVSFNNLSFSNL